MDKFLESSRDTYRNTEKSCLDNGLVLKIAVCAEVFEQIDVTACCEQQLDCFTAGMKVRHLATLPVRFVQLLVNAKCCNIIAVPVPHGTPVARCAV